MGAILQTPENLDMVCCANRIYRSCSILARAKVAGMSDIETQLAQSIAGIRQWLDSHSRLVILGSSGILGLQFLGVIDIGLPEWWPILGAVIVAAGVAGYFGGEKVAELIPSKDGIILVSLRADEPGGEIWELSEDEFAELFTWGTLHQWDNSARRVYEVRSYDPKSNAAVGNWRESEPASVFASEKTVEDAFAAIRELRQDLEPEAAKSRELRRRIRGIIRQLDKQRAQAFAAQLDEETIDHGIDADTVSEIIDDELPDDLHPDAGRGVVEDSPPEIETETNGSEPEARIEIDEPAGDLEVTKND